MLPRTHVLFGAIVSFLIFCSFQITFFQALIIFFSSFLIDFDHYLYYIFKKEDINLKRAYKWFMSKKDFLFKLKKEERKKYEVSILIFHGVEFCVVLLLAMLLNMIFKFVLIGFLIHMILDFVDLYVHDIPLSYKLSQFYVYKRNKKLKSIL